MTEATVTKKSKNPKAPKLFPDELIDQLLAQIQNKDAESVLGESGLAGQLKKQLAGFCRDNGGRTSLIDIMRIAYITKE